MKLLGWNIEVKMKYVQQFPQSVNFDGPRRCANGILEMTQTYGPGLRKRKKAGRKVIIYS